MEGNLTESTAAQGTPEVAAAGNQPQAPETPPQATPEGETQVVQNPLGEAAKAAATAEATANAPWYNSLPEESHEILKEFDSLESALSAVKRGKDFNPPEKIEDLKLKMPDGINADESGLDDFKQFCVDAKIPAAQAQQLLDWQAKYLSDAQAKYREAGEKALREKWSGDTYQKNVEQALVALTALDRRLDGRLAPHLKEAGLANDPLVVETLYELSTIISEDSLGGSSPGGGGNKEISADEKYAQAGFK